MRATASALLLALLCACTRAGEPWGTPGEVRIAMHINLHTLVPMFAIDQRQIDLTQLYTQPLVGIGADNKAYPLLITEMPTIANGGISRDARTITYRLRRGVRFADGVELTSADVAFTYHAILDPRNPVPDASAYRRIARIETPDRYTVRFRLRAPWANAPRTLFAAADFLYGILPAHAFDGNTDLMHAAWSQHPFGTGPFRVVAWHRGDSIVFEPNPYASPKPRLHRVVVKFVPDQNAAFIGLQNHSLDMVELAEPQVARARRLPGVNVIGIARNETEFAHFDVQRPLVSDPRVRLAITQAIDRAEIARTAFYGLSPSATTEIPNVFAEHDATVMPPAEDRAAATAYFKAHPLPHPLLIIVDNSSVNERNAATIVQQQLATAGIPAEVRAYPSDMIYAPDGPYYGGRYDLEVGGWFGGLDAEQSEYYLCSYVAPSGPNTARLCDRAYDAAYAAQVASLDPAVRARAYRVMQQRIAAAHAIVPFVYLTEYLGINASLRNVKPDMLYNFGNIAAWEMR